MPRVVGSSKMSEHWTTTWHRTPKQDHHLIVLFLQTEQSSNRTSQNNVFFMLHIKNKFSSTNKDNPAFSLILSECSFNYITSLISQSMHLTPLASTMLVVLLTTKKIIHYPSVLNFTARSQQSVCTKTNSFSPSTVVTSHTLCYLPTQPKPLPSPHHFSFYLDIIFSPYN